jgi:hypothetical protein
MKSMILLRMPCPLALNTFLEAMSLRHADALSKLNFDNRNHISVVACGSIESEID